MRDKKGGFLTQLRHLVKKIPGIGKLYYGPQLMFCPTLLEDGLSTVHNVEFLREESFKRAYGAAEKQHSGRNMRWRSHVAQWAGFQASFLEGDFVECGVNRAFLSTSVMEAINFKEIKHKNFYLVDTFSGLVPELLTDKDRAAHWNEYPDVYDFVVNSFKDYPNVHVVKGAVPDILPSIEVEKVCYLSIDMNCVAPERAALEYFWPKLVQGGIIILDDYLFKGHEAQKETADEFAKIVGARILSLPTGQGLLIKQQGEVEASRKIRSNH